MGNPGEPVQEAQDHTEAPAKDWTWHDAVARARAHVDQYRLPAPKRPAEIGREYDFPTDPVQLTSAQLGALRLRLSGFHGYVLFLVGKEDVELDAFQTVYDIVLGDAMAQEQRGAGKRIVTDVLRAITIQGNDTLKRLTRAIMERRARVGILKTHLAVYEAHLQALSREQSRREMEARTGV